MNNGRQTNSVNQKSPQPALRDVVLGLGEPQILVLGDVSLNRTIYGRRQSLDEGDAVLQTFYFLAAREDFMPRVGLISQYRPVWLRGELSRHRARDRSGRSGASSELSGLGRERATSEAYE